MTSKTTVLFVIFFILLLPVYYCTAAKMAKTMERNYWIINCIVFTKTVKIISQNHVVRLIESHLYKPIERVVRLTGLRYVCPTYRIFLKRFVLSSVENAYVQINLSKCTHPKCTPSLNARFDKCTPVFCTCLSIKLLQAGLDITTCSVPIRIVTITISRMSLYRELTYIR